jgi:hypothetical protein
VSRLGARQHFFDFSEISGQQVEPSIDLYPLRERDAFLPPQNERAWVIGRIFHFVKDFYDFVPRAGWVDAKGKRDERGNESTKLSSNAQHDFFHTGAVTSNRLV